MKIGKLEISFLNIFLVFVPIAFILEFTHADGTVIFVVSGLAIIPLAGLLGEATEHLSEHVGPGIGGLLNATFGNAAELIIAIFALQAGLYDVVKASITGSIIGNILLVLGLSIVAGGLRFKTQSFNALAAGMNSTLLLLSTAGLVVPALFFYLLSTHDVPAEQITSLDLDVSLDVAIVLFITYILSLVFSLQTHKHLFDTTAVKHDPLPCGQPSPEQGKIGGELRKAAGQCREKGVRDAWRPRWSGFTGKRRKRAPPPLGGRHLAGGIGRLYSSWSWKGWLRRARTRAGSSQGAAQD